jgi:cytochrome c-type biogenesis protein CcmE
MAETTWEKVAATAKARSGLQVRFAAVGFVVMAALAALLLGGTLFSGRFFITVDEVVARPELAGKSVKISGAVIGETIRFDPDTQTISFTIAHVPDNIAEIEAAGGLAEALHLAVSNPTAQRLSVVVRNQAMPDLLQDEAQAILTGRLGEDGVFYASDLQLKCPSKYEGGVPKQAS